MEDVFASFDLRPGEASPGRVAEVRRQPGGPAAAPGEAAAAAEGRALAAVHVEKGGKQYHLQVRTHTRF